MDELLSAQTEIREQLEKALRNFKKSPKARLTKTYINVKLNLLEELWTKFTANHLKLICLDLTEYEYIKNDHYTTAEDFYTDAKCVMLDAMENLELKNTTTHPNQLTSNLQSVAVKPEMKLPRINLPTFSGKYIEWVPFHDMFLSLIHNNVSLNNVQKLHYLKSSLSGEAATLLRHIPVTEANYDNAWQTLKRRFNNKRFIVTSIIKRLMTQRAISTESSQSIKTLIDTTNECLSGLNNMDIPTDSWDPLIIYITVSKLDTESVRLWEQQVNNSDDQNDHLPTFLQLSSFLESRFRTLEILESSRPTSKSISKQSSFHAMVNSNCKYCKGNHFIYNCREFARISYTDRLKFIERNGLCYNCLIPHHTVNRCKQKTSCRRCGRRHHSLIHPENKLTEQISAGEPGISHVRENSQNVVAETQADNNVAAHYAERDLTNTVLLATAVVKVETQNGTTHYLRALIDQGSQGSFITESAAQFLGLKKIPINCTINGLGEDGRSLKSNNMVIFNTHSRYEENFATPVKAYVLKSLTRMLPPRQINNQNWSHLHNLKLADPNYDKPGKVDLLLGADIYSEILKDGLRKGPRGTPLAQNTHLGWMLSGQLSDSKTPQSYTITISMHLNIEDNQLLQKFWEIESDVACKKTLTEEEIRCEKFYAETHKRDEEGRYTVTLPFKEPNPTCQYGSSRQIAEKRLLQLERKLVKNPELHKEYSKVMDEYLKNNHMEEIVDEEDRNNPTAVYLPHHAVIRTDKTTTKVRVVFDASCKYSNDVSLNDNLMVGPRLQQDLRHIVTRWRLHKVCLVADIAKMYLQVKVDKSSSDYQRLLWRDDSGEIKDYRITRVTFGTASAPYLATKTLQQLALDESKEHPLASSITLTDFYMDDLLTGGDGYMEGVQIFNEMSSLLRKGGFQLQKWNSNDKNLLKYMKIKEDEITNLELKLDATIKTLGIAWNNKTDKFEYSISLPEDTKAVTKRCIASDISKLFDPMGWLAPTIIIGKIFLQRLWLSGVTWDQDVPNDIREDWMMFRSDLPKLSDITVERWLHTAKTGTKLELYGFADASTMAYAAVVYSRVVDEEGNIHVNLISAKTRVAPVKTVSVPRLELCGAVLLARLLNEISELLNVAKMDVYAYTDSKVVLAWLQSHPSKWKTFVANRTSEIITLLPAHHWNHVLSKENPADVASRGVKASMLKAETIWWKGPTWLQEKEIRHEILTDLQQYLELEQRKTVVNALNTNLVDNFSHIFTKYSTLEKLLRIIAICKRFRYVKNFKDSKYLSAKEIEDALSVCIVLCQKEEFSEEIDRLKEKKALKKTSKLLSLDPFLDERGFLRVGGRLRHANIPEDAKHQIILPNNHPLSKLIINQAHRKTLHGGPTLMLNYLRQRFWIVGAKSMINREMHKCVICLRQRAATRTQIMAHLPKQRVTPTRPFLHSGVDFAGPIDIRISKGRGCKTRKGYLCIFICMATCAIHIEIVSSLESEDFVAAFKRFTARRGHCSDVWSDNATNFIAGNKLLKEMFEGQLEAVTTEIQDLLARDGTTWHNIPAAAPHFGGLWEAGVRSIKHHLRRILGNTTLTYEEMSTATSQIEACLNSRPISPISDDINDLLPLTPGHFLIGEPPITVPEKSYLDINTNRLNRWQLVQKMVQHFWDRWTKEYLSRLQQRPKWVKRVDNDIKIGDLVIVKDDNLPPSKWSLARILDVHPGSDGLIRVVTLKCRNSIVKRPITKVCPLPVD